MKKLLIPLISVMGNAYFVLVWVYVYNAFEIQNERVSVFLRFIPRGFPIGLLYILLISLSIISAVIIANGHLQPRIKALFIFVQGLFTCLFFWQLL